MRKTKASRLHEEQGLHLQYHLEADTDCSDLAVRWTASQARLAVAIQHHVEAGLAARRALAARHRADSALDREVRLLRNRITALVDGHRIAPLLEVYFPNGSYRVTAAPVDQEAERVEAILAKLESETNPLLLAQKEPLRAAFTRFRTAIAAHEAASQAERTARGLLDAARDEWFRDYERMHHALSARFVDDPARVEGYFLDDRRVHKPERG